MKRFKTLSEPMKIAYITASATVAAAIIGAVIGGIFLLRSTASNQPTPTATSTNTGQATTTISPTNTPIATTTLTPTSCLNSCLLYQADWSKGMDGWSGGSQWGVNSSGILVSNGNSQNNKFIVAPYRPTTANYAVEAQIQFLQPLSPSSDPTLFGIMVRGAAEGDKIGYDCYMYNNSARIRVAADPNSQVLQQTPYTLDTSWHTYRVEVNNNSIKCFIDNMQVLQVTDNTYMLPGEVGLLDINSQINVRSFTVVSV